MITYFEAFKIPKKDRLKVLRKEKELFWELSTIQLEKVRKIFPTNSPKRYWNSNSLFFKPVNFIATNYYIFKVGREKVKDYISKNKVDVEKYDFYVPDSELREYFEEVWKPIEQIFFIGIEKSEKDFLMKFAANSGYLYYPIENFNTYRMFLPKTKIEKWFINKRANLLVRNGIITNYFI